MPVSELLYQSESLGAGRRFEEGDLISLSLRRVWIADFHEDRLDNIVDFIQNGNGGANNGEIAVLFNVRLDDNLTSTIHGTLQSNEDGRDDFGRVVFYTNDVTEEQKLNFDNIRIFGPIAYNNNSLQVSVSIIELDNTSEAVSGLMSGLEAAGSQAFAPGDDILGLLNRLGEGLANNTSSDTLFRYSFELDPRPGYRRVSEQEVPVDYHMTLETGHYLVLRTPGGGGNPRRQTARSRENGDVHAPNQHNPRTQTTSVGALCYDPRTSLLYQRPLPNAEAARARRSATLKTTLEDLHSGDGALDPPLKPPVTAEDGPCNGLRLLVDRTYVVFEISRNAFLDAIDQEQVSEERFTIARLQAEQFGNENYNAIQSTFADLGNAELQDRNFNHLRRQIALIEQSITTTGNSPSDVTRSTETLVIDFRRLLTPQTLAGEGVTQSPAGATPIALSNTQLATLLRRLRALTEDESLRDSLWPEVFAERLSSMDEALDFARLLANDFLRKQ